MNLLVVLLVLGARQLAGTAEPSAMVSALMRRWRDSWLSRAANEGWNTAVALGFVVLPPALLVLVLSAVLAEFWHGLLTSVVSLVVMLIVLLDRKRPDVLAREQQAWLEADERYQALVATVDAAAIQQAAAEEFGRARRALLAEQLRELFSPLFWFLLLGPAAAIAYYFLRLSSEREQPGSSLVQQLLHYADWPVTRVLSLSFALAGDFMATWQHWRSHVLDSQVDAATFLDVSAAGAQPAALAGDGEGPFGSQLGQSLVAVAALLQRSLVIWVVLLALHTLWP